MQPVQKSIKVQTVGEKSENKAVGRTKGGINTKIHAIVDGLGNPVAFLLSPGNDGDSTHAKEILAYIK
ncbi:MAG: transposase, partial [Clostridia bacterium]|nr:transposase [Clostridia bacterium]